MTSLALAVVLCGLLSTVSALNVALHAQVAPNEKVVGSVITTDGLKAAFDKVPDVDHVELFYPYSYDGFHKHKWDLILIEGWFPSIDVFLLLARNYAILNDAEEYRNSVIVYICLDHTYPGLSIVSGLDVDGYLTNSRQVLSVLSTVEPTRFMLLAADPDKMKPLPGVVTEGTTATRPYGAVYVGAGGLMLKYKPQLVPFLLGALPYGLRLHGSGWDYLPVPPNGGDSAALHDVEGRLKLKEVWLGSLPQHELAAAYASASAVIAITVETQAASHMINNRIFEALACGCIVISSLEAAIVEAFGDVVLFSDLHSNENNVERHRTQLEIDGRKHSLWLGSVGSHLEWIRRNPREADELRNRSRQAVLERHTWAHRVVDVLGFYHGLRDGSSLPATHALSASVDVDLDGAVLGSSVSEPPSPRNQRSKLLWVVSANLLTHADYLHGIHPIRLMLAKAGVFEVVMVSEEKLATMVFGALESRDSFSALTFVDWLVQFRVVLGVFTPFDTLDLVLREAYRFASASASGLGGGYSLATSTTELFGMLHDPDSRTARLHTQRRCAFALGFDPALVDAYDGSLMEVAASRVACALASANRGAAGAAEIEEVLDREYQAVRSARLPLSRHHDMLWTRSYYELGLIEHYVGEVWGRTDPALQAQLRFFYSSAVASGNSACRAPTSELYLDPPAAGGGSPVVHPLRTQQGFGLCSALPDEDVEAFKAQRCEGRSRRPVAVCLFEHSFLCNDVSAVSATLGGALTDVMWLLVGGEDITEWFERAPALYRLLSDKGGRLALENVVMVASLDVTRMVLERHILCASQLFYFHRPAAVTPLGQLPVKSVDDVLWPFVGGRHLVELLLLLFVYVFILLPMLSSCAATLYQTPLHLSHYNAHLMDAAESGSDAWDHGHSMRSAHEGFMRLVGFPSSRHARAVRIFHPENSTLASGLVVLSLSYGTEGGADAFIAGLDGQLCLDLHGEIIGCLLRSFRFVVLDFGVPIDSGGSRCVEETLSFKLQVRGNMLGDIVHSSEGLVLRHKNCSSGPLQVEKEPVLKLSSQELVTVVEKAITARDHPLHGTRELDANDIFYFQVPL